MTTPTEYAKKNPCDATHLFHSYGPDDKCIRCQKERPASSRRTTGAPRDRAPARSLTRSKTRVRGSSAMLISGIQTVACALAPELEEDALSQVEVAMLADALADEVDGSPRLKKWVGKAQTSSTHVKLAIT